MRFFSFFRVGLWIFVALLCGVATWIVVAVPKVPSWVGLAVMVGFPPLWGGLLGFDIRLSRLRRRRQDEALEAAKRAGAAVKAEADAVRGERDGFQRRYTALLETKRDVALTRDGDSRLTYANDRFFEYFALDPDAAIGQPFAPDLHPCCRAEVSERFSRLETGETGIDCHQRIRTRHGWRWFSWQDRFVRDGAGRIVEIQSIGCDIEDFKKTEADLQAALKSTEAENKTKTAFLLSMCREIRASINGVKGMAERLLDLGVSA